MVGHAIGTPLWHTKMATDHAGSGETHLRKIKVLRSVSGDFSSMSASVFRSGQLRVLNGLHATPPRFSLAGGGPLRNHGAGTAPQAELGLAAAIMCDRAAASPTGDECFRRWRSTGTAKKISTHQSDNFLFSGPV